MDLDAADLKSSLWNCAEILRGSAVDRTDWKAYILPLLFFKRICDVWDEETADAAKLYGDVDPVDFPEVHRFNVPEGCSWRDVRATPANVGAALSHAMREIERANPDTLYRVFGAADWGNREILTDEILKDLIEGLSEVSLGKTPIMVERVVDDIDEIVRYVRFDGWQNTHAGEREVKMALRKTLFRYKLHQDQGLFDRAYGYVRQYY